jgi:hypothetical protein
MIFKLTDQLISKITGLDWNVKESEQSEPAIDLGGHLQNTQFKSF